MWRCRVEGFHPHTARTGGFLPSMPSFLGGKKKEAQSTDESTITPEQKTIKAQIDVVKQISVKDAEEAIEEAYKNNPTAEGLRKAVMGAIKPGVKMFETALVANQLSRKTVADGIVQLEISVAEKMIQDEEAKLKKQMEAISEWKKHAEDVKKEGLKKIEIDLTQNNLKDVVDALPSK